MTNKPCVFADGCIFQRACSDANDCRGRVNGDLQTLAAINMEADSATAAVPLPLPAGVDATLAERGKRYGKWDDNAEVSQSLKRWLHYHPNWRYLDMTKKEALEMIAQKIARILNGDPEYKDNWHDIAGYAKLAEDYCNPGRTRTKENKT